MAPDGGDDPGMAATDIMGRVMALLSLNQENINQGETKDGTDSGRADKAEAINDDANKTATNQPRIRSMPPSKMKAQALLLQYKLYAERLRIEEQHGRFEDMAITRAKMIGLDDEMRKAEEEIQSDMNALDALTNMLKKHFPTTEARTRADENAAEPTKATTDPYQDSYAERMKDIIID